MIDAPKYVIREVDGFDADHALDLEYLHYLTFWDEAPQIDTEVGHWWLAYCGKDAVAFAGMLESTTYPRHGYFYRVGVAEDHRGHNLQNRLMRAMESRAQRNGWSGMISDCTNNSPASANSFIRAGYRLFWPERPWGLAYSMYWRKRFGS